MLTLYVLVVCPPTRICIKDSVYLHYAAATGFVLYAEVTELLNQRPHRRYL